jgi:hypothetical protein
MSTKLSVGIASALVAVACLLGTQAGSTVATPGQGAVLVELFTSEDCSGCPPADALLRQVNGTQTRGGKLIVGISEHVTYWNQLGWSDPYSSPANTERQNDYGQHFHLEGVYTPQMVINGSQQIVGSDRAAFARAVQKEDEQHSPISLRILSLQVEGNTVTIAYSADGAVPLNGAEVIAVLADDYDRSNVLHGENAGETLAHVAVARSLVRVARLQITPQAAGERTVQIKLPPSFQAAATHHVILFAQTTGNGPVLAADTKPL